MTRWSSTRMTLSDLPTLSCMMLDAAALHTYDCTLCIRRSRTGSALRINPLACMLRLSAIKAPRGAPSQVVIHFPTLNDTLAENHRDPADS